MGEMTPEQREAAAKVSPREVLDSLIAEWREAIIEAEVEAEDEGESIDEYVLHLPVRDVRTFCDSAQALIGLLRAPGPPTDEEVERAMVAFSSDYRGSFREDIRAALTAFLAGKRQEETDG